MKSSEIREMGLEEVERELQDAEESLFNLKLQLATRQLDNPVSVRMARRNVARLKTILNEHYAGVRALAKVEEAEPEEETET